MAGVNIAVLLLARGLGRLVLLHAAAGGSYSFTYLVLEAGPSSLAGGVSFSLALADAAGHASPAATERLLAAQPLTVDSVMPTAALTCGPLSGSAVKSPSSLL